MIEKPYISGKDVPPPEALSRWNELVKVGQESFANTALITAAEIGETEVLAIYSFFESAATINPETFNPDVQEHLNLTAKILHIIGEILNEKGENHNLFELQALGLLHDLGRTFSHRKGRNERIGITLAKKIGVREDLMAKLPPDEIFNPHGANQMRPKEIDTQIANLQRVIGPDEYHGFILLADLLGKRSETGRIRRWEQVTKIAHVTKSDHYQNRAEWPSEINRMTETLRPGHEQAVNSLYHKLGDWAEERLGISLDELIIRVETPSSEN